MPIFEFKCSHCETRFEELLFSYKTETKRIRCPSCGSEDTEKLMSASSIGSTAGDYSSSSQQPKCPSGYT